jgi:CheY-like chemotaxis protein
VCREGAPRRHGVTVPAGPSLGYPLRVSASAGDVERPLTVMIVDNSDDYRQLAVGVLAADGYDVIAASDGREALDLLRDRVQTNAILVLTGLAMPSFSGRRLLDEIEREGWSQFVLVVVITGAHEPDLPPSAWWVQKPVGVDQLLSLVGEARAVLFDRFLN